MFMTESWLKNEEEERKRAVEEATRKEQKERKRNEEAEIKKRKDVSEGLRLTGCQNTNRLLSRSIAAEAQAWKKFISDQAGPSS